MRRIEPAFPDLFPITHRLGPAPALTPTRSVALDPVEMRLVWRTSARRRLRGDRTLPRRPVRLLLHSALVHGERAFIDRLVAAGCGILVIVDEELAPEALPAPTFDGQLVALAPWLPPLWGGAALPDLKPWTRRGIAAGVLLSLAPAPEPFEQVNAGVAEAKACGATFVVGGPLSLPPGDRHRIYEGRAGEGGDEVLENLLFHTDLGQLTIELERETSRACRPACLAEGLPGPATSVTSQSTFAASVQLFLWARRLDLLDGVSSSGWQLRRAARALLASRRDPQALLAEDNLRVVPGFTPWVEAFARSAWGGSGEPYDEVQARWLAH
jgi:hypothetical protein